MLKKWY